MISSTKTLRHEAVRVDEALHDLRQIGLPELKRRQVDGNVEIRPALRIAGNAVQHPCAERGHEARVLGNGNEGRWRDLSPFRVTPPQQCLGANDLACAAGHDRLILQAQLVALDGRAQIDFDRAAGFHVSRHVGGEEDGPIPPLTLRIIERNVGVAHQLVRRRAMIGRHGDTDRGFDAHGLAVDRERLGERCGDPFRQALSALLVFGEAENGELVAAEAGNKVARSQPRTQTFRHGAHELIAGFMTERVVDILEFVDVHVRRNRPAAVGAQVALGEPLLDFFQHMHSVRQAGEGIVPRCMTRFRLTLRQFLRGAPQPLEHLVGKNAGSENTASDERQDHRQQHMTGPACLPREISGLDAVVSDETLGDYGAAAHRLSRELQFRHQKRARDLRDEIVVDVDDTDQEVRNPPVQAQIDVRDNRDGGDNRRPAVDGHDMSAPARQFNGACQHLVVRLRLAELVRAAPQIGRAPFPHLEDERFEVFSTLFKC